MKNLRRFLVGAVVLASLLVLISPAEANGLALTRIQGGNRFETAVEVSKAGWEQAEVVVLARGDDFADALAGIPLAYALDAPILLTHSQRLVAATRAEIQRLGAERIIILGGPGAISGEVEEQLVGMGLAVERINGDNRFQTAAKIAEHETLSQAATAVLAYGMDYPDALAAASYAARNGFPLC